MDLPSFDDITDEEFEKLSGEDQVRVFLQGLFQYQNDVSPERFDALIAQMDAEAESERRAKKLN